MQCPRCQHSNPDEAKFCMECGTRLENICPNCGTKLPLEAKFCMECGTRVGEETSVTSQPASPPKLEDIRAQLQRFIPESLAERMHLAEQEMEGENRLVTALFADISGFTPMSQELTPEAVVEKVNQCFQVITDAVYKYEGNISQFIGDGVLAFFGAPLAHENDPERAILSALDMREAVSQLRLNISVGINTGMTYFGPVGAQQRQEISAYGHDINLAKRLQEAAEPGQIFIGASTYRMTRRAFDFGHLGILTLKGIKSPGPAYEVLSVKEHPEKLRGIEGLRARMIGRENELAELKKATEEWLLRKQGQIVSITGEAGIGKSRLVEELREYLDMRQEDGTVSLESGVSGLMSTLEGRCISIGQPITYWPFLDILRTYFGLDEEDDFPTKSRRVTEATTRLFGDRAGEVLPFLGYLLTIRFGNELDDRLKFATPEQIRHQTLMRLRDFFETLAKKQPLLLILEDLHWADALSLDLLSLLMDVLATTPLMLFCVYRLEREHRVSQLSDLARRKCPDRYTEITLSPLSSRESRELVDTLLTIGNFPEGVKDMILRRSEGNPFFIEEVIRSLIERELVYREDDVWKARAEVADIDVPDTIQSVVMARVDLLQPEAKYVLQCASVIGRQFSYPLLEHLKQQGREVHRCLSELEGRELVYEERTAPELEYAFRHTLTQETIYQNILERRRRGFHHQAAQGIEILYQERLEEFYEELAHHYSKSDDTEKAVEYLLKAGEKVKRSYSNEAAISYFQKALEMQEQHEIRRNDWRLEALRGLGEVYLGIGKNVEAEKAFEEAIALAKEMELPPRQLVRLYYWISEALYWQGRYDEMIHYGETGLEILGDDTECLEAALMNSQVAMGNANKGNMGRLQEYTHKNMEFIEKLPYSVELRLPYEHIVQVLVRQDGDLEAALEWAERLEARSSQYSDLRGMAAAWLHQGNILTSKGSYKNGLLLLQRSLDTHERIGDTKFASWCYGHIAEMLFGLGDIEEAEAHARLSLMMREQVGSPRDIARAHEQSGQIAMCKNCWEEAAFHFQKFLEGYRSIGDPFWIASAHHCLGVVHLRKADYPQAIRSLEEAADVAVETQQASWLYDALARLEEAYMALGTPEEFVEFCRSFKERHANAVRRLPLRQWYLEQAQPSKEFSHLVFADGFETETIDPSWVWVDEFGDCAYRIVPAGGLEISAANGRDLYDRNLSAPRFIREISGDFAVEVRMSPASDEKPQIGGLLVWKDRDNFLRFEKGVHGQHEVRLRWPVVGRGLLPVGEDEEVYLRLERIGEQFSSYCSADGDNWLTCGKLASPLDDPVQIGIYAIGMIDRSIYCGSFKDGTATLFRGFRVWTQ